MTSGTIDGLIRLFSRLPGLGQRSARRIVLQLLRQKERLMLPLAHALLEAASSIRTCGECGNLDVQDPCTLCCDARRDAAILCVVEDVADLWAIERVQMFRGRYHVIGGTLSALDGRGPDQLNIASLPGRVRASGVKEVLLAMNATVEGQTTAHYLTELLSGIPVIVSRLAQGIPIGGELDYLDDGTLGAAIKARLAMS